MNPQDLINAIQGQRNAALDAHAQISAQLADLNRQLMAQEEELSALRAAVPATPKEGESGDHPGLSS